MDEGLTSSDPVFLVGWGRVFGVMKYKVTILNSVTACPALWIRNSSQEHRQTKGEDTRRKKKKKKIKPTRPL